MNISADIRGNLKQEGREKSKEGWEKRCNDILIIVHNNTGNQNKCVNAHPLYAYVYGETRVIPFKLTATVKLLVWVFT